MNRDGYILVAVLSAMLVLAGLIGSASLVAQSALRSVRADDAAARLEALLRGGLELAAFQVFSLKRPFGAVNGSPIRLAGGTVVATFTDGAAKVDLNASDPKVLAAALAGAGVAPEEVPALIDRLMAMRGGTTAPPIPSDATRQADAPDTQAGTRGPHTDFASLADFAAFAGLDPAVAARLPTTLTVDNPDGRVDVTTASRAVLMALPEMSEALAEVVIEGRRNGLTAVETLKAALGHQADMVKFEPGPCFGVDLAATDVAGHQARRRAVVAASRSPDRPFLILAWESAP